MFTTAERRTRDETHDGSETSVTWHEYIRKKWIILYAEHLYFINLSQTKCLHIFPAPQQVVLPKIAFFFIFLLFHRSSLIWKGLKRFGIPAKHSSRFRTHLLSTFRSCNSRADYCRGVPDRATGPPKALWSVNGKRSVNARDKILLSNCATLAQVGARHV